MNVTKIMATVAIAGAISCPAFGLSVGGVANSMPNSVVTPGATLPQDDDWWWGVGGHEKLPTGGHENAHSRPIRTAHRRTRKCPPAAMNLPRPT